MDCYSKSTCCFLFVLLLISQFLLPTDSTITLSTDDQLQFFVLMNNTLSGTSMSDWDINGGKPLCNFSGVACDGEGFVVQLDISGRSLSGRFPANICSYLPELRVLRLGGNSVRGGFPDSITNCSLLEELSMPRLYLTGRLPDFSPMKSLRILDLSYNLFVGKFPMSVFNLTNLEVINFNENGNFNLWKMPRTYQG
ncbi:hypothetical protein FNV43_RR12617 [Rhamnella rubrinervis]|uniref:Leucine-rich repeat-containing N-terminal plant-type domain-containing protein n=1 Tax=Rhamnella rubrinervis TaxID=2594499 RepID=A0A8K0H7Z7_9ROSA|nr:hypothetical protein FNV43_RR11704 [Rhamnella rubrinervis]KAF3447431.1 hypothetical protein FNV43_RR12617 [Rhamnella rubrinervis]